jgi:chemotaxis protein CheC
MNMATTMVGLTDIERSALMEVERIVADVSTSTLSRMVGKPVEVSMIHLDKVTVAEIPGMLDKYTGKTVALSVDVTGDLPGSILLFIPEERATQLADMLYAENDAMLPDPQHNDEAALKEVVNIMAGTYIRVLSDTFNFNLNESLPHMMVDDLSAVLEAWVGKYSREHVLIIEVKLTIEQQDFKEDLLLVLTPTAADRLLASIMERHERAI